MKAYSAITTCALPDTPAAVLARITPQMSASVRSPAYAEFSMYRTSPKRCSKPAPCFSVKRRALNQHTPKFPNKLIPKTIAHTEFSWPTIPVISPIGAYWFHQQRSGLPLRRILARRTLLRRVRILGQKFLDVMRGVSQPFCHEDFCSILVNRETLPRCCGATGRV